MQFRAPNSACLGFVTTIVICSIPTISRAQVIAASGFNHASGINSDATPNSPYTIGQTVDGRGAGVVHGDGEGILAAHVSGGGGAGAHAKRSASRRRSGSAPR